MSPALEPLRGKYEIVAKIREGGMGAIYKVRHRLLEEVRVVKVLRSQFESDPDLNRRFAQEARAAIRLRHPNVVQIFDFLLEEGVGYIVMEFIDGVDLGELIKRRRLPSLPVAIETARQSLRALGYLHQQGFVHRDISPDNLMLGLDFDGKPQVKMIDLGISKQLDSEQRLTASGMFLGKFRYSSPEHFGAQGPDGIDRRSDLYSFGVVLYELLTGHYPIRGNDNSQLIAGHLFHPPLELEESDPTGRVPPALREIVLLALDKDPDKRFQTAEELTGALDELRSQFPMTETALAEVRELTARTEGDDATYDEGSTQDQLDRGFDLGPTPAPSPAGVSLANAPTIATPAPLEDATSAAEAVREAQLNALLTGAETLYNLEHMEQARLQVEAVLQIDPHHVRGRELYERVTGAPPPEPPPAPPPEPAAPAPAEVARQEEFDRHLEAACSLAGDQHYGEALPHFEAALELQGDNEAVRQMLQEARAKLEEEQQAAHERLLSEVGQLRELVGQVELEQARDRLLSARRAYGEDEVLRDVQQEIEEAEKARRHEELLRQLEEVAQKRFAGELTTAIQNLEKIRQAALEGDLEIRESIADEEAKLEEAHRLVAEIDETMFRIERLIGDGKLVEADRELYQAFEAYGQLQGLQTLRQRLDGVHHKEREIQVRTLIDEARRLAEAEELKQAVKTLEKAAIVAPQDSPFHDEIAELVASYREQRTEQVRVEVFRGLEAQIRQTLEEDGPAQALAQLETLAQRFEGPTGRIVFEGLRQAIADAYQERINVLIKEAGAAIEARRYQEAIGFLEEALAIDPTDEWIQDRLSQAREALGQAG